MEQDDQFYCGWEFVKLIAISWSVDALVSLQINPFTHKFKKYILVNSQVGRVRVWYYTDL